MQELQEVKQSVGQSGKRVVDMVEHVVRSQSPSEFRLAPSAIAVILTIAGGVWVIKSDISEGPVETVRLIQHVKTLTCVWTSSTCAWMV